MQASHSSKRRPNARSPSHRAVDGMKMSELVRTAHTTKQFKIGSGCATPTVLRYVDLPSVLSGLAGDCHLVVEAKLANLSSLQRVMTHHRPPALCEGRQQ